MVNNSNNISKTNNHLSSKESLNSDGQQFQQYKRSEQSPLISNSLTTQETRTLGIQVLPWVRHTIVAGLSLLMGSLPSPLDNWIFKAIHAYINDKNPAQIWFHSKRSHTLTKMNDNITWTMDARSKLTTS